ncbi:hypothetical protein BC940DRAFT_294100 [Gongronella butleri]|nr:hypothetical protein BC940DRAFT_294100 [Gongronella butleri]
MSTFSKNAFSLLSEDGDVKPEPVVVKEEPKPVVAEKPKADKRAKAKRSAEKRPRGEGRAEGRGEKRPQQGGRQRGRQFDRHSATGLVDNEKKEKQGWGHPETAEAEAAADTLSPADPAAPEPEVAAPEPEENVKTLDEYLAEKASKGLKVSLPEARKANEGSDEGKWKEAVAFTKAEEPDFLPAKEKAAKKEKARKEKVFVDIEQKFQEKPRFSRDSRDSRDSRGAARGGRRQNNNTSGRRGDRRNNNVNLQDDAAFPTLGATA